MSASESEYPLEASPTKVPWPSPLGGGAVHTNQSVASFCSSIWVAALAAPKRKLPLPEAAEVLPIAGQAIAVEPGGKGTGVTVSSPPHPSERDASSGSVRRAKLERRMLPLYHRSDL